LYSYESSENICSSSSGGTQEKGKPGRNSVYYQKWWFSEFHTPSNANVVFCRFFFESHPGVWPKNSGLWCCVFFFLVVHSSTPTPRKIFVTNTWSFYKKFAQKNARIFWFGRNVITFQLHRKKSIATLLLFVENIGQFS
jgi:hypothetical protein